MAFGDSSIHLSHHIKSIQIKSSCAMYAFYYTVSNTNQMLSHQ
nr:MAG TPA_asm: hypothetical protein [Caudoviricetes sp.]